MIRSSENVSSTPDGARRRRRCTSHSSTSDYGDLLVPVYSSSQSTVLDDDDDEHSLSLSNIVASLKLDIDLPCPPSSAHSAVLRSVGGGGGGFNPDAKDFYSRTLFSWDQFPFSRTYRSRTRAASGDSGYSARINMDADLVALNGTDMQTSAPIFNSSRLVSGSMSSLEFSLPPTSPALSTNPSDLAYLESLIQHKVAAFDDDAPLLSSLHSASLVGPPNANGPLPGFRPHRRQRTFSESSDIDVEEGRRLVGNQLLHQLMHDSHKPSCADHPTNLDQEIGQSILGQVSWCRCGLLAPFVRVLPAVVVSPNLGTICCCMRKYFVMGNRKYDFEVWFNVTIIVMTTTQHTTDCIGPRRKIHK